MVPACRVHTGRAATRKRRNQTNSDPQGNWHRFCFSILQSVNRGLFLLYFTAKYTYAIGLNHITWRSQMHRKSPTSHQEKFLDCNQSNVLFTCISRSLPFSHNIGAGHATLSHSTHVTQHWKLTGWSVAEIWPFKVLPGRLFQDWRSSVSHQYYTDLIYSSSPH